MTDYISLHNQTDYSILDSLISPKEYAAFHYSPVTDFRRGGASSELLSRRGGVTPDPARRLDANARAGGEHRPGDTGTTR